MNLTTFDFNDAPVRALLDEHGEPWFVAADVCRVLDLENTTRAVEALDADDLNTAQVRSESANGVVQNRSVNTISEAGLYQLVFASRKVEAKAFKRWVTKEVLPAIRRTGRYEAQPRNALSSAEERQIDAMIAKIAQLIEQRHAGLLDNGTASVLGNLCSQYLRAWDVKLRLRTPSRLPEKGADA